MTTREQLISMLYQYTKAQGGDVSESASLAAFSDAANTSAWAQDAMEWAVAIGLIEGQGDGSVLAPGKELTRAEVATIIMRYVNSSRSNT